MNRLNLRTFLEAAAITVCLCFVAGQNNEIGTLASQTTIQASQGMFNNGYMLGLGNTLATHRENHYELDAGTDSNAALD